MAVIFFTENLEKAVPVSRIEFASEYSLYRPIVGLGPPTLSVAMRYRDPAGQSEFFVCVLRLKIFNLLL